MQLLTKKQQQQRVILVVLFVDQKQKRVEMDNRWSVKWGFMQRREKKVTVNEFVSVSFAIFFSKKTFTEPLIALIYSNKR